MELLSWLYILLAVCVGVFIFALILIIAYPKYDKSGFDKEGKHNNSTKYDDNGFDCLGYDKDGYSKSGFNRDGYDREGYRFNGYNREGYDRKGNYDRLFDVAAFDNGEISIDGFYDPKLFNIGVTDHAAERFAERMGITDEFEMDHVAFAAYRYGKTERQLSKKDAYYIKSKKAEHPGKSLILYDDFYFVFSQDNSLVTLFPKEHEDNYYDYSRYYR